jgi:hypothetical protein
MKHRRGADALRVAILSWAAFVLGHDLLFLLTYGSSYDAVLARTGHGEHWSITAAVVAGLAVALAVGCLARLRALAAQARAHEAGGGRPDHGSLAHLGALILRTWPRVTGLTVAIFIINENLERLSAGLGLPGLTVLGALGYLGTFSVLSAFALLVAIIEALYRWRRDVLLERVRAAGAHSGRPARASSPHQLPWVERRHAAIAGHRIAGRAPPLVALA